MARSKRLGMAALVLSAAFVGPALGQGAGPIRIPDAALEPLSWSDLDGWAADDHAAAFAAFLSSCRPIVRGGRPPREPQTIADALKAVCRRALAAVPLDAAGARAFFEANFRPVAIARLGEMGGLLTGYYEPVAEGSKEPNAEFTVPMYRRPADLVVMGAKAGMTSFPNRAKVVRRLARGKTVPYYDRAAIDAGALDGRNLEICWLKDPTDAFMIQIQGSARIRLQDGSVLRLNYDAHNGYSYTPVGRLLIERKIIPREQMSADRIRKWMEDNPEEARALRQENKAFVFFRVADLSEYEEAVGGQGASLTAGRSIAIDRSLHPYGLPFWIEADLQIVNRRAGTPFHRLMVAQDTGSAIVGPARADIFFGAGEEAGRIAGRIRNRGRFVMLVPREVDPVAAGAEMPMPRPRPPEPAPVASTLPDLAAALKQTETAAADRLAVTGKPARWSELDGSRSRARQREHRHALKIMLAETLPPADAIAAADVREPGPAAAAKPAREEAEADLAAVLKQRGNVAVSDRLAVTGKPARWSELDGSRSHARQRAYRRALAAMLAGSFAPVAAAAAPVPPAKPRLATETTAPVPQARPQRPAAPAAAGSGRQSQGAAPAPSAAPAAALPPQPPAPSPGAEPAAKPRKHHRAAGAEARRLSQPTKPGRRPHVVHSSAPGKPTITP